jgi:hypothetical protein
VHEQCSEDDRDVRSERYQQGETEARSHPEDQRGDAERREAHRETDDLDDDVVQRLEHGDHRPRAVHGDHRQGSSEDQGKEDDREQVQVGGRPHGVSWHDVDQRLDPEVRRRSGLHLRRGVARIRLQQLGADGWCELLARPDDVDCHEPEGRGKDSREQEISQRLCPDPADAADVPEPRDP